MGRAAEGVSGAARCKINTRSSVFILFNLRSDDVNPDHFFKLLNTFSGDAKEKGFLIDGL